ncbi:MAG TPA: type II toxin-antitoxin system RelE/ParE family toxin [Puia sp.]|nr:type II toxin-antitoxin system RelE/ParE family toxin [Puia sp.]
MNYSVLAIPPFDRQIKRLVKKYPSLKKEYADLIGALAQQPDQGTPIGNHCYKIRLAITSKGKGKSGGARVITYVQVIHHSVYLLAIYDKAEQADIADTDLKNLLKLIP